MEERAEGAPAPVGGVGGSDGGGRGGEGSWKDLLGKAKTVQGFLGIVTAVFVAGAFVGQYRLGGKVDRVAGEVAQLKISIAELTENVESSKGQLESLQVELNRHKDAESSERSHIREGVQRIEQQTDRLESWKDQFLDRLAKAESHVERVVKDHEAEGFKGVSDCTRKGNLGTDECPPTPNDR